MNLRILSADMLPIVFAASVTVPQAFSLAGQQRDYFDHFDLTKQRLEWHRHAEQRLELTDISKLFAEERAVRIYRFLSKEKESGKPLAVTILIYPEVVVGLTEVTMFRLDFSSAIVSIDRIVKGERKTVRTGLPKAQLMGLLDTIYRSELFELRMSQRSKTAAEGGAVDIVGGPEMVFQRMSDLGFIWIYRNIYDSYPASRVFLAVRDIVEKVIGEDPFPEYRERILESIREEGFE